MRQPLILFLIAVIPILICLAILKIFQRQRRRSPFTRKLERTPGGTLSLRIDELAESITFQTVALIALPLVLYAGYITHLYVSGDRPDPIRIGLLAISGLPVCGYFIFSIMRKIKLRRSLRLGFVGELTVGQSLNRMMLEGWWVCHDFPADGFSIDHILVGAKGVFAIETTTWDNPVSSGRPEDATVTYDGRMLHFPADSDDGLIAQAKRQSKWLARWLSDALGEPLTVRAVIVLPGWLVKRVSPEGPPVVNPAQFDSLFKHIPSRPLSPDAMTQIVHLLDKRIHDNSAESLFDDGR